MEINMKNIWKAGFLVALTLMVFSCQDADDKLNGPTPKDESVDVSSRISGFANDVTGSGSVATVMGSRLSGVEFVLIDDIFAEIVEISDSELSFLVPESPAPSLGMVEVMLLFSGQERATTQIEVVANPTFARIYPTSASTGDEIIIRGSNLDAVTEAGIGEVAATIVSQSANLLVMTVPSGAQSGSLFYMVAPSGSTVQSEASFVSCEDSPESVACMELINTNGGFEDGDTGVVGEVTVDGWTLTGSLITSEIVDEDAYEGFQSAKITINEIGGNPWSIQPTSTMEIDPTATYHLSIWVKGSGIANMKFAIDEGGSPGWGEFGNPEVSINSDDWTEISYEFSPSTEAPPAGDNTARFAISMSYEGNVGGVVYLDNLRVVKLD